MRPGFDSRLPYSKMKELIGLLTNKIVWSVVLAWLMSFLIKLGINYSKRGFSKELLYATGGMPSSHVAFSTALALSVGLAEGFNSTLFIIVASLTVIIVHDAINIRAKIDKRFEQIRKKIKINFNEIDTIGHTIVEVIWGIVIGLIIPLIVFYL